MAEITAALVKDLREKSGAGMMDCKKALQENGGDVEASMDWLRTKGMAKAAKKADRAAAEGLVAGKISADGKTGALVEFNAETDFVAKNDGFQAAAREFADVALAVDGGVDAITAAKTSKGELVSDAITNMIATIGENMRLRRSAKLSVSEGAVALYLHNKQGDDVAKLAVLVALEGAGDQAALKEVARRIALHVAGTPTPPLALNSDELDPDVVAKEREIQTQTAIESGKPREIAEKMVEGRIRKWQEEVVLLKQPFVMNPDQTIEQLIAETAKETGSPVVLKAFVRFALGEGVEKAPEGDFAAEVASMTGQA
ncbi:MAG: translation elongation factor Ts [Alphaproteobacteria bacterium]|nr:translation elongation factor Ts [Alphaproteobacteria bacterium]MBU1513800.1 translation elongation factor Ts [Alphaproteobacteria bacterium]MBU2094555.1 translation elongation factor Ts [Alphaproteobacteria bacterium]MBU2151245.1 translation elongation factor Ts [Alphaproteobacteria bacterium]MBU2305550.1 translation elongation factor Ts [Alphaproteobacteria bacterium]